MYTLASVLYEELSKAASKVKDKKAYGNNGVPNIVIIELSKFCPL